MHSRERKYVSHAFSPKAMVDFEPYITNALTIFPSQMENLLQNGQAGQYIDLGRRIAAVANLQRPGEAAIDAAQWLVFLAFDIIGNLVRCLSLHLPEEIAHKTGIWGIVWLLQSRLRHKRGHQEVAGPRGMVLHSEKDAMDQKLVQDTLEPPSRVILTDTAWTPYFYFDPFSSTASMRLKNSLASELLPLRNGNARK